MAAELANLGEQLLRDQVEWLEALFSPGEDDRPLAGCHENSGEWGGIQGRQPTLLEERGQACSPCPKTRAV